MVFDLGRCKTALAYSTIFFYRNTKQVFAEKFAELLS